MNNCTKFASLWMIFSTIWTPATEILSFFKIHDKHTFRASILLNSSWLRQALVNSSLATFPSAFCKHFSFIKKNSGFFIGHGCSPTIFPFPPFTCCTVCKFMCTFGDPTFIACMSPMWQAGYNLVMITFIIQYLLDWT